PIVNVNGIAYFDVYAPSVDISLWKSDGTSAGTSHVADVNPGPGYAVTPEMVNIGTTLYFTAPSSSGINLYKTAVGGGVTLVKSVDYGGKYASSTGLTELNGALYFSANDGTNGQELWRSDGTTAGTVLLKDINPGSGSSGDGWITNVNGTLFFTANDGVTG